MMLPPVVGGWARVLGEPIETERRDLTHESDQRVARPIKVESACVDVFGTTMQFLMLPEEEPGMPCIIRETIPPATVIPMHSHPDPETCFMISGNAEGLAQTVEGFQWIRLAPHDAFHMPGRAKQAFRNHWPEPAVMIAIAPARRGRFFLEVGKPVLPTLRPASPPTPEAVRDFLETAARYGYWIATREENFQVGIDLPAAAPWPTGRRIR